MAALSRQLKDVPDDAVRDLVRWFIPRSEQVGGRMRWYGRNIKLTSKVHRRRRRRSGNTVLLGGTPAAGWSIKSYGRHTGKHGTTDGDGRWDKLVAEADRKFPDVVADLIDRRMF